MGIESSGSSDVGCVRTVNEDRCLIEPGLGFYAVCDGMGGHQHGELAAELALEAMLHYVRASCDRFDVTWPFGYNYDMSIEANRLATSMRMANHQVWRHAEQKLEYAGMGTTIAAVLLDGAQFVAGNVGDSRIYLFRAGVLTQLSVDDTIIASMLQRGLLTDKASKNHPMRNVLTQAAGSQEIIDAHIVEAGIEQGDAILLSTDGLHGVVPESCIRSILESDAAVEAQTLALIDAARAAGGPDNVSAVLLSFR